MKSQNNTGILTGLMGLENDGRTLVHPDGRALIKLPRWLASRVQALQHRFARDVNGNRIAS
jgi:hypothetical protein